MNFTRGPVIVLWNYGYWCNKHCYSRLDAKAMAADMTTNEAEHIAEQLIRARVMHVHFGGGEPLGRKDFLSIARMLANEGIYVTLSTNGSLIFERVADALADVPLSTIAFSIHGSDAKSHDWFNEFPGAWQKLVAAIHMMVQRNIKVKLVMVITKPTAPHAVQLLQLAHEWGVYMVQFQTFKRYGNANRNLLSLNLTRDGWRETFEAIRVSYNELVRAGSSLKVDLGLDGDPVLAAEIGLTSAHERCPCGIFSVTIAPNGDILPCPFAPEPIGNMHSAQLLDLWQNSPILKKIREGKRNPCEKD
jgi:MoaA/NifB/PqqE/SkfB family radical SAM enzyme